MQWNISINFDVHSKSYSILKICNCTNPIILIIRMKSFPNVKIWSYNTERHSQSCRASKITATSHILWKHIHNNTKQVKSHEYFMIVFQNNFKYAETCNTNITCQWNDLIGSDYKNPFYFESHVVKSTIWNK